MAGLEKGQERVGRLEDIHAPLSEYAKIIVIGAFITLSEKFIAPWLEHVTGATAHDISFTLEENDRQTMKHIKENPALWIPIAAALYPLAEEWIFRKELPAFMDRLFPKSQDGKEGIHWEEFTKAAIASTVFAAAHIIDYSEEKHKVIINMKELPFPQFAMGLYFWYLARGKNLKEAIVAHMVTNTSFILLSQLLDHLESVSQATSFAQRQQALKEIYKTLAELESQEITHTN